MHYEKRPSKVSLFRIHAALMTHKVEITYLTESPAVLMWPPMLVTNVTSEENILLKTTIFEIVRHNKIQPINISLKNYLKKH